ncbi:TetR/AcrR family transcriptional regulator [Salipaludibacillus daqingensis]|uniref:TetR/AcrR family transcriptional regulator n=1 Tax=Salipaludibacillus daqingensis TaxID=3041001 RepID=UPI0024759B68|nr:TetR/AcrR family transcriptional regulator [Salipaludibacillus daqingensis]
MAPKKKFSKQQIVDAAFDIARVEGMDSITIRKVAEKLGSSIAPIYVNFQDVDELINDVIQKVFTISHEMVREQNSGSPFRDIGIASLKFAKEYSVLFRELTFNKNKYSYDYDEEIGDDLVELMKEDPDLKGFTEEELRSILLKMKIFQTGLTVLIANDSLPEGLREENLIEMLDSMSDDVIRSTRLRKETM